MKEKENRRKADHECIFLPKFHHKLNPIEMVCQWYVFVISHVMLRIDEHDLYTGSIGDGQNISIGRFKKILLWRQRNLQLNGLMPVWMK